MDDSFYVIQADKANISCLPLTDDKIWRGINMTNFTASTLQYIVKGCN